MTDIECTKVAVVILNWNGKEFLEKFLPQVMKYCPEYAKVFIADNASTDDSITFLTNQYPDLSIIQLDRNYGYTGGYNKSLAMIDAQYYVLLNSDITVNGPWIETVIDLMDQDNTIAACQPKIRSYYNPEYFEYAGAAGGFIDLFGYPFCRGRVFNVLEKDYSQYDDNGEIFWATGACMFVRASHFWEAGALDDDFFAHMEEIDLCWRFRRMGLKIVCCTDSVVFHVGGGSLPKNNPRKTYFNFRNNLFLIAKNLPRHSFYPVLVLRFFLDYLASLKFFLTGYNKDCFAVHKAWAHALRLLGKKRKQGKILKNKKVPCIYMNSVAVMYFIFRRRKYSQLKSKNCKMH